jgi:hypothetical protein
LHFPFLKFVKRDIFSLWGGETILSEHLARLIESGEFKGGEIDPYLEHTARRSITARPVGLPYRNRFACSRKADWPCSRRSCVLVLARGRRTVAAS